MSLDLFFDFLGVRLNGAEGRRQDHRRQLGVPGYRPALCADPAELRADLPGRPPRRGCRRHRHARPRHAQPHHPARAGAARGDGRGTGQDRRQRHEGRRAVRPARRFHHRLRDRGAAAGDARRAAAGKCCAGEGERMDFDYVIVGGGSAGCVLAGRLSADPATRVCLIEAGPSDDHVLCRVPFATAIFVPGKWRNWAFETVPQPGLNGRRGYQPRGRMLGGSSGINAMIYIRGHASDYDDWAAQGAQGWSFADVLPYFKRAEGNERLGGDAAQQGRPAQCRRPGEPQPAQRGLSRGLRPAAAAAQQRFQRQHPGGRRPLPGDAKERRALERGARLPAARGPLTREPADRHGHARTSRPAVGTACHRRRLPTRADAEETINAGRAVILSAGAFQSPQLLLLSGIGPAGRACTGTASRSLHELPGVGQQPARSPRFHADLQSQEPAPVRLHAGGPGPPSARDPALAARASRARSPPTSRSWVASSNPIRPCRGRTCSCISCSAWSTITHASVISPPATACTSACCDPRAAAPSAFAMPTR